MEATLRELQEELQKVRQRAEDERRLRELAETRAKQAETQAKHAETQAKQAEGRAKQAEGKTRRTTFEELLESCHKLLGSVSVQTDKSMSTQGSTTSPEGKCCPKRMLPWTDFPRKRQEAFEQLYKILHPPKGPARQLFSPLLHFEELGNTISGRKIASEEDLKKFHQTTVEDAIANVISTLVANNLHGENWTLGKGLVFDNHTNGLSDLDEDVRARLHLSAAPSEPQGRLKPIPADQICVLKTENEMAELLFVIEYKAPQKISKEILRTGLRAMNVPNEVVNRSTIPTDPVKKFEYNADKLVAAVATQTYSYMLKSGSEYSCIITGEAIVFLWIKEDDSNTLYYHLAEPNEEVRAAEGDDFEHPLTAIGQLLSFCVMALQSARRTESWREKSLGRAHTWSVDLEKILHNIPYEQTKLEAPPSAYKPPSYSIDDPKSPYYLRKRQQKSYRLGCSPENEPTRDNQDDPAEDSGDDTESIYTPTKKGSANRSQEGNRGHGAQISSSGMTQRHYCTQACLLGLVRGSLLDENCPNTDLHRQGKKVRTHMLHMELFTEMVRRQLGTTLDSNCEELGLHGARGILFKVTLASHGYTFVGKATREVFVSDLKHEGRMYDLLRSVQGKQIPVYLGNIDLIRPWYDLYYTLIHMLLMSWGGERLDETNVMRKYSTEVTHFESQIARLGVQHEDIRPPNMLWNQETGGVMFIDFERSIEVRGRALQEITPNRKRKRSPEVVKTELENHSQELVLWSET